MLSKTKTVFDLVIKSFFFCITNGFVGNNIYLYRFENVKFRLDQASFTPKNELFCERSCDWQFLSFS